MRVSVGCLWLKLFLRQSHKWLNKDFLGRFSTTNCGTIVLAWINIDSEQDVVAVWKGPSLHMHSCVYLICVFILVWNSLAKMMVMMMG